MPDFCHLHNHTQFSLLDGASDIPGLMKKAVEDGQQAVALTDHGNMFGAFKFVAEAKKKGIKAIVGCEFYLVEDRHKKSFIKSRGQRDVRYHQLLLAKNQEGYQNLSKLCSLGFIEGFYSKFPRIDKELIEKYHKGLIATSCCIGAEIPQAILQGKLDRAEELVKWWLNLFGDDFYIELQRHEGLENIDGLGISQEDVNQQLIQFAKKYNIKIIATNDTHYVDEEDWRPHDILLCVNTGSKINTEDRFKFPSTDFYFKSCAEMQALFHDYPEAIANTMEVFDKIESPQLKRDIILPNYPLPQEFKEQSDFL
ncbi:MAG: PHP domain-containing protein, partial [Melioribacteraceae bacterium]|nr:PHP domain-containing protein [Melioribacteraceae bacterium]